jgi:hypothetical protein
LKSGIESLSGLSLDDVRVHYNSSSPAQLQALAYTQGTEIHVAPGQERHIPHEAWHVVQQSQGRVGVTTHLKGIALNDDDHLEREADRMGELAVRTGEENHHASLSRLSPRGSMPTQCKTSPVIQRRITWGATTEEQTYNLAAPVFFESDFGTTPTIINDTEVEEENSTTIIPAPTVAYDDKTRSATITAEPVINIHCHMQLPVDPPWQRLTTITNARSFLAGDWPDTSGVELEDEDAARVDAHGLPDDANFARLVKKHENHHVEETAEVAGDILAPWDSAIGTMMKTGRTFTGTDEIDAKNKLYAAAGGTPGEIGTQFFNALKKAGVDFHHTPEGASPVFDKTRTRFTQGAPHVIDVYWKHPLAATQSKKCCCCCCFITTACVQARGLPDDCDELTTLRAFRDGYIMALGNGKAMIKAYYENSPAIVEAINRRPNAPEIYEGLYGVIHACVRYVQKQEYERAFQTYVDMVIRLRNRFTPMAIIPACFYRNFKP